MNKNKKFPASGSVHPGIETYYKKFRKKLPDADTFVREITGGNRQYLSRAITLIESASPETKALASEIIRKALPYSGKSFRIGITGVPGVGKSTFIDRLGTAYVRQGHRVAVLAIDPSSALNKGSILGDKTRMENLLKMPRTFIRPSPSGNYLGGVGRKTRETIILCEAAGYDRILVETVGVGQSEIYVHSMTDLFVLLKLPGAGDELQGIKRGVMEMADMIIINKADGEMKTEAERAVRIFRNALHYFTFRNADEIQVMAVSSLQSDGITEVLRALEKQYERMITSGRLQSQRKAQLQFWFDESLNDLFKTFFENDTYLNNRRRELLDQVKNNEITPFEAAEKLWRLFLKKSK